MRTLHRFVGIALFGAIVALLTVAPTMARADAAEETEATPAVEAPAVEAATARERLLKELQSGFPDDLPFFGLSLFGVADALAPAREPTWQNIPVTPVYQLGPGDEIIVSIWGAFDMDLQLQVNERGFVTVPGADRFYVNGLQFGELEEALLRALRKGHAQALTAEKLSAGTVRMRVTLGDVHGIQVLVTGQVNEPGGNTFDSPSALLMDALTLAGGITPRGSLRSVEVRRGGETRRLDLYDLLVGGQIDVGHFLLRQDDVVYVPYRQRTVSITGAVRQPAIYEIAAGEKLDDLIRLAGGLAADADPRHVQIERQEEELGTVLHDFDLKRQPAAQIDLHDGDRVRIAHTVDLRRRNVVEIVGGGVRKPGLYELDEQTVVLRTLLSRVGLYEDAILERCLLIRMLPDYTREKIQLDLALAMEDGFRLQPEDRLIINSEYQLAGGDKRITLEGHVKEPGRYLLSRGLTLYDVLFNYGGFDDTDHRARTYLPRSNILRVDKLTGLETILPFDLAAILERRDDFPLESEDVIVVYPKSRFQDERQVRIDGEVRVPGVHTLTQSMTLGDLLVLAGGLTDRADSVKVELSRVDTTTQSRRLTLFVDVTKERGRLLRDGDLVNVRRQPQWKQAQVVILTGEVTNPGRYPLEQDNERLSQVIKRAGGLTSEAFIEGAIFHRTVAGKKRRVALNIVPALQGVTHQDLPMLNGDSLHVPRFAYTIDVRGEVLQPKLLQYVPGKSADYYISAAGGATQSADLKRTRVQRANGLMSNSHRAFWFDPAVPPGSSLLVPAREADRQPLWRSPYVVGILAGLASGLGVFVVVH